jgi:hypothetical protein
LTGLVGWKYIVRRGTAHHWHSLLIEARPRVAFSKTRPVSMITSEIVADMWKLTTTA